MIARRPSQLDRELLGARALDGRSWQEAFLDELSQDSDLRQAAEVAGVSIKRAAKTRARDMDFALKVDIAFTAGICGGDRPPFSRLRDLAPVLLSPRDRRQLGADLLAVRGDWRW